MKNTNILISSSVIESILKVNYIFNNVLIILKPYIIKVSPKSDITIVWLDIWDVQSGSKAKSLINKFFQCKKLHLYYLRYKYKP